MSVFSDGLRLPPGKGWLTPMGLWPTDWEPWLHWPVGYYLNEPGFICYFIIFPLQLFLCSVCLVFWLVLVCVIGRGFFSGPVCLVFCMLLVLGLSFFRLEKFSSIILLKKYFPSFWPGFLLLPLFLLFVALILSWCPRFSGYFVTGYFLGLKFSLSEVFSSSTSSPTPGISLVFLSLCWRGLPLRFCMTCRAFHFQFHLSLDFL